jgi:ribosome-binding factor A
VSEALLRDLDDPRIGAMVSVTRVRVAPDLRSADVYLSLFGSSETVQNSTFSAIKHASRRLQSLVGTKLRCKFCPVLKFHKDDNLKKTIDTINLIEETARGFDERGADPFGEQPNSEPKPE